MLSSWTRGPRQKPGASSYTLTRLSLFRPGLAAPWCFTWAVFLSKSASSHPSVDHITNAAISNTLCITGAKVF
jgi:hypothetical protein